MQAGSNHQFKVLVAQYLLCTPAGVAKVSGVDVISTLQRSGQRRNGP
jgi:hypothetical protein